MAARNGLRGVFYLMVRRLADLLSPQTSQPVLNQLDDRISHRQLQNEWLQHCYKLPAMDHPPELDSADQKAKWERSKPYIHLKFLGSQRRRAQRCRPSGAG